MQRKLFKSFLILLCLITTQLFLSCIEEKNPQPEPAPKPDQSNPVPTASIPETVAGKWMMGTFSMGEFWKYDGSYVGNAFELGVAFDFKKDGQCEFYLATGGTSYSCRTEAFIYKKGKVEFTNTSFTFFPLEGSTRGFYKGCASSYQNYNQKIPKENLKPETYQYTLEKDSNGKNQLLIRFKAEDQAASVFRPVNW